MKVTLIQECHVISEEEYNKVAGDLDKAFQAYASLLEQYNYHRLGWGHHLRDLKEAYVMTDRMSRDVGATVTQYLEQIVSIREAGNGPGQEGKGWASDYYEACPPPVAENMTDGNEYETFEEWTSRGGHE